LVVQVMMNSVEHLVLLGTQQLLVGLEQLHFARDYPTSQLPHHLAVAERCLDDLEPAGLGA
jgi:hypothetical protein